MTRVLSSTCVVVLLLVLGGQAWAGSKVAVLGLEVRDSGTGIDPETTKVAKDLTFALRQRAATNAYNVSPAPNGDKELIDEKLLNNCDSEAASCMSAIGTELGADLLLFGKIDFFMGGDLIGGSVGEKASEIGWDAEWMRDGIRGSTRDRALAKAVEEMKPHFDQCHRCGQWVCGQVCWNRERGMCVGCAPKLDQEIAGMQAAAQVQQLNQKIQAQDWTRDINYRDQGTAICPNCHAETGGGKFCASCGTALAAAPPAAGSIFATSVLPEVSMPETLAPSLNSKPCFSRMR